MTNVAIIGSNGFIGSHLVNNLSKDKTVNLSLFGRSDISLFNTQFPYFKLELQDVGKLSKQFSTIDIVYYLASATIPSTSWESPTIELQENLLPFINFTEAIAKLGVKKIVFVSSAGTIYGPSLNKLSEESDKQPFSPYGIIKLTIEHFLNYFKAKYGINYDIYRVSNVYGEGQNTTNGLGIINTFIEQIILNQKIQIFGNGDNIRNYVYVKDVAEVLSYSLKLDPSVSNIYNIASNDTISINALVSALKKIIPIKFEVIYTDKRQSDNSTIDVDNAKILSEMPNFRFTTIERGISEVYNYISKQQLHLK